MLDERSRQVLYAVVQSYIHNPEPVGSRFVTKKYSFGCSPATIRNIMADLEDLGFLDQPHTSAGRVPTDKGYRLYVDALFDKDAGNILISNRDREGDAPLTDETLDQLTGQLTKQVDKMENDMNRMFSEVTSTLSMLSNYVVVALPPNPEKTTFNRIDLLRYRGDSVVAILLTKEGVIKNRILKVDARLTQDDLNRISDFLNAEYAGYTLDEIKGVLLKRIKQEKMLWDNLIARAIKICEQALSFTDEDVFVSGLYDVMNLPDFSDISKIKEIARALKDKHLILKMLEDISNVEGVHVLIGKENPAEELKNLSIVASSYKEKDRPMGVIALIGPTRMNYSKAICMVDAVAKCLSRTFD